MNRNIGVNRFVRLMKNTGPEQLNEPIKAIGCRGGTRLSKETLAMSRLVYAINKRLDFIDEHPPLQHVKDGKPQTAEGARLLGIPWC